MAERLFACLLFDTPRNSHPGSTIREDRKAYLTLVRVRACARSYQITYANPSVATSSRALTSIRLPDDEDGHFGT